MKPAHRNRGQIPMTRRDALAGELAGACRELSVAYSRFNEAVDPELIESCVFRINAEKARCDYLLRAVRESEAGLEQEEGE